MPGAVKLNVEEGELIVVTVPEPAIKLQVPTPTTGAFAAKVVTELLTQTVCDNPAFATVGIASTCTLVVEVDEAHTPLEIVHCTIVVPVVNPVKLELALLGVTTVPLPETIFHNPFPTLGMFAFNTVLPVLTQMVWDGPALETVGTLSTCIVVVEMDVAQIPFAILHCKTFIPGLVKLYVDEGEFTAAIVPVPDTKLHVPTPTTGAFAANVVTELLTQTV